MRRGKVALALVGGVVAVVAAVLAVKRLRAPSELESAPPCAEGARTVDTDACRAVVAATIVDLRARLEDGEESIRAAIRVDREPDVTLDAVFASKPLGPAFVGEMVRVEVFRRQVVRLERGGRWVTSRASSSPP